MHLELDAPPGAAMRGLPHFVENAMLTQSQICQILSESFFMVRDAALLLQQGQKALPPGQKALPPGQKALPQHRHAGDLPQHLQVMINILRSEDKIKLAVRLESVQTDRVRYMVVVYSSGRQDAEESALLGMDFTNKDSKSCSIGLVLPLWSDTKIHLDGDGGFSVSTAGRTHIFKPVSVQAMWSALQVLHKVCEVSRRHNYFPGGTALAWTGCYESCLASEQSCINEWNSMKDLETTRPDSPALYADRPTERERTECLVRAKLRSIMMSQDLENVTSKEIRTDLEQQMNCNLKEYKEFIDNEMLVILGQMDKATPIFDHLYLGSEWNASNLEELQNSGVGYILNVTREIDNFFPGTFAYYNIRVYDEEAADLLAHWNDTYNFIVRAKKNHSKCLVHCKMGVSRSASTVIAYAMKEYGWSLDKAYSFVKQKRSIACPNAGFMRQLAVYEGILDASKQRHNKLWGSGPYSDVPDGPQGSAQSQGADEPDDVTAAPPPRDSSWGGASCRAVGTEVDPADPPNFNYCFRRLSDSALDSEPSTPVRTPGGPTVYIEVEDVERDALLDDAGFGSRGGPLSHLHREPLEELRARLEFSTVEEEDEEDVVREETEAAQLEGRAPDLGNSRLASSSASLAARNRFNNENANNSNRLSAKRSCPSGFDDSASIGKPYKVKPSYQPTPDGPRMLPGRGYKAAATDRSRRLNPARFGGIAKNALVSAHIPCHTVQAPPPALHFKAYRQQPGLSASCEGDPLCPLEADAMEELQEDEQIDRKEGDAGCRPASATSELTLLELSLGADRPPAPGDSGQHQVQLEQPGLVQKQGKSMNMEGVGPVEDMEMDTSGLREPNPSGTEAHLQKLGLTMPSALAKQGSLTISRDLPSIDPQPRE
ncbi:protein phosphatase Slingshot homolog 1-like isoform X2 [Brienomyrus brachyistius]|uniref:protein phosphatase Slingshot homolog 1-like isoform X2 n=1 Tax=Brienomyrus brachyistius TaxID=42636 RepID=UPI0020B24619|nr:protein phosphatase Slingshot homolog 1-like isoform X2 [Brienomyrus brachyistius]